jgi:hypothetical protein
MQSTIAQETERITLFIPADINTALRVFAARERKSLSETATEALSEFLNSRPMDK